MLYGTCSTAASTAKKTATISGFSLYTGVIVSIKFTITNTAASPTLNINGTGAKQIYYRNAAISAGYLSAGRTLMFVYNGSRWEFIGDLDTNNYDRIRYNGAIKAGTAAIVAGNIIVGKNGVYQHLKSGASFDLSYPILYAGSAIAAKATGTNNYVSIPFNRGTTQALTLTSYRPVYIKGKLNKTIFTPVSTAPLTQTVPTKEDGYQYVLLGTAYSTTNIFLMSEHPVYQYYNGGFKTAAVAPGEVVDQVNAELKIEGNRIELTAGHFIIDAENIKVDEDGNVSVTGSGSFTDGFYVNVKTEGLPVDSGAWRISFDASGAFFGLKDFGQDPSVPYSAGHVSIKNGKTELAGGMSSGLYLPQGSFVLEEDSAGKTVVNAIASAYRFKTQAAGTNLTLSDKATSVALNIDGSGNAGILAGGKWLLLWDKSLNAPNFQTRPRSPTWTYNGKVGTSNGYLVTCTNLISFDWTTVNGTTGLYLVVNGYYMGRILTG